MIDCNILANGDLQLTLDDPESDEFADSLERHGFLTAFCDGMESDS